MILYSTRLADYFDIYTDKWWSLWCQKEQNIHLGCCLVLNPTNIIIVSYQKSISKKSLQKMSIGVMIAWDIHAFHLSQLTKIIIG